VKIVTWTAFAFEALANHDTCCVVLTVARIARVLYLITIEAFESNAAHTFRHLLSFAVHLDGTITIGAHELTAHVPLGFTKRALIVEAAFARALSFIAEQRAIQVTLGADGRHFAILALESLVALACYQILCLDTLAVVLAGRGARLTLLRLSARLSRIAAGALANVAFVQIEALCGRVVCGAGIHIQSTIRALVYALLAVDSLVHGRARAFDLIGKFVAGLVNADAMPHVLVA
jgi:hypothetical protein